MIARTGQEDNTDNLISMAPVSGWDTYEASERFVLKVDVLEAGKMDE